MFASIHTPRPAAGHLTSRGGPVQWLTGVTGKLGLGLEARAQRRALAALDPHLLADLGITRDQALAEASRPLWDVPAGWRR